MIGGEIEKELITSEHPRKAGMDTVELYCSDCGELTHYPERICPTLKEDDE